MLAHRMQLWRTTNAAMALSSAASRYPQQVSENRWKAAGDL